MALLQEAQLQMKLSHIQEARYMNPLSYEDVRARYADVYHDARRYDKKNNVLIHWEFNPKLTPKVCQIELLVPSASSPADVTNKIQQWAKKHDLPYTEINDNPKLTANYASLPTSGIKWWRSNIAYVL